MSSLIWLGRGDLAGLACPYCGRRVSPNSEPVIAAEQAWGFVGAGLRAPGETTALLLLTPVPATRDALLTCLWVGPGHVGRGSGKRLIQASAAGLLSRDVPALVARGSRVKKDCGAPPVDFLRAVGFSRALDERLYRLDLESTITHRSGLRAMLQRLAGALRPLGPEPVGRVSRHR